LHTAPPGFAFRFGGARGRIFKFIGTLVALALLMTAFPVGGLELAPAALQLRQMPAPSNDKIAQRLLHPCDLVGAGLRQPLRFAQQRRYAHKIVGNAGVPCRLCNMCERCRQGFLCALGA
jgi:hypothetical protein